MKVILLINYKFYSFYNSFLDLRTRKENIFLNKFLFYKACPEIFLTELKSINFSIYKALYSLYDKNDILPVIDIIAKKPKYFPFIFIFCNHICEFTKANDILSFFSKKNNFTSGKIISRIILDSYSNNYDSCKKSLLFLKDLLSSYNDKKYSNLISGNSITIVGSGNVDISNINSDFLIFFNPINQSLKNHKVIGYYRGEYTQNIIDNKIDISNLCLEYYNFKDHNQSFNINVSPKRISTPTFSLSSIGSLNGVQDVCIDLYVNDISSVNITGVNFLLLSTSREGYRPSNLGTVEYNKTFGVHPPLSQFLILKAFYILGFIKPDKTLDNLLKLSPREFSQLFQKQWGRS